MFCDTCNIDAIEYRKINITEEISGYVFKGEIPGFICPKCNNEFYHGSSLAKFELLTAWSLINTGSLSSETFNHVRQFTGLTKEKLCNLLDITKEEYSNLENGKRQITISIMAILGLIIYDKINSKKIAISLLESMTKKEKNTIIEISTT